MINKKSVTHNFVYVQGVIFKYPMYICDRYELYLVKHQNLGELMCQVIPIQNAPHNSIQYFFNGTSQNFSRYSSAISFFEPLFFYNDTKFEYVFYHKFITLGEIIAKRIVRDAPTTTPQIARPQGEISADMPSIPSKSHYEGCLPFEICSLYERMTGGSVYQFLLSNQIHMLIARFGFESNVKQANLLLEDFNVHRYCFKMDKQGKLCSNLEIYDYTTRVCGTEYLIERKKILIQFAVTLYRIISPSFDLTFEGLDLVLNQKNQDILINIFKAYQERLPPKEVKLVDFFYNYKHPWLTRKTGFMIFKILTSIGIDNNKYLSLMVWREFFEVEGFSISRSFENSSKKMNILFTMIKFGFAGINLNHKVYIANKLPLVYVPQRNPQQNAILDSARKEDAFSYTRRYPTEDFQKFKQMYERFGKGRKI